MHQIPITNETLKAILSAIDEGIHAVDARGMTIYYNHIAAQLDGMQVEEVQGKHLLEVFPSLNVETSTLLKVIETREPIYHQHQSYRNVKGKKVVTVNTTVPILVNGEVLGAVEVAKDISKVKELSEKLIDLQAQMVTKKQKPQKTTKNQEETGARYHFTDIITENPQMEKLIQLGKKSAQTSSPILIMGETGTGKELLVQSIHNASARRNAPFIAQNCAALPATLLEGILFGTVKGSFTGAEDRPGLFELADGGSLFLDEINSMPMELQAKLLRVIQENRVRRVGGTQEISVDVRLMAALNEDPQEAIRENRLRSDLYYRLHVVSFLLPPLRERKEDIERLTQHFVKKFNYKFNKLVMGVSPKVSEVLNQHDWPGNIRELEHTIEAAMNMVEGNNIEIEDLSQHLKPKQNKGKLQQNHDEQTLPFSGPQKQALQLENLTLREAVNNLEDFMIEKAMEKTSGNILQAAKILGIPRQTLQYKLAKGSQE
ncbi:sigma-54 interaction domain-containing protein [Ammoniphilus resinae]|uniref:Arginine utilization regulatory protein n=1 Tax=Ammoniphilus resinae TaxID=861532 RepID=A0ABS4GUQ6_9BACL|nr:sigma 54-interacting transcriptional regulator [Ammoniphilus resinae]MBP1933984.1 arginine utilization regulatory protein [Ammoniphilus resinae]